MFTRYTAFFLTLTLPLAAAIPEPVHVESGALSGVAGADPEVRVFKGIPYAAPPVGDLRWRAPKPALKWEGVRAGDTFGPNCMQRQASGGTFPPGGGDRSETEMKEDCLFLNVYTAAKTPNDKRPVMVWIHGGALTAGSGSIYEGEELAAKGAVVVTINYRLGTLGFFAHPELSKESDRNASGNYGLLDQVAALEWVQKNIAAFGGDPKRVTIFGESAGSWSVNLLTASPLAKGLFQRAIGESGGEFAPVKKLAAAEQEGVKFAKTLNAESLAELRKMPAEVFHNPTGFVGPDIDGWFLPEDLNTIFAQGKQNDVPTLIGSNADEGTMFTPLNGNAKAYRAQTEKRYGADAENIFKLYPFQTDEEARAAQAAAIRDYTFGWEMRTWARAETKAGKSKVFVYYFSHVPPGDAGARLHVHHGAEIPYVFNWPNGKSAPSTWQSYDHELAGTISSYWLNFAATGDPNGKGLPKWPAFRTQDDKVMEFGDKVAVAPLPHKEALDFLDRYFEHLRQSGGTQ